MSNSFSMFNCRFGHVISDGGKLIFLGEGAEGYVDILLSIVTSLAEDMSKLTGIPIDDIINDYMEENETNPITAAFNAVLHKRGHEIMPTYTRCIINKMIEEGKPKGEGNER